MYVIRKAIILVEGHESKQYVALRVIVGLLYNFTIVKMKGPNKTLRTNLSNIFRKQMIHFLNTKILLHKKSLKKCTYVIQYRESED